MPLFTKFKRARESHIEPKKTTPVSKPKSTTTTTTTTPYKHVPTHAAQDALAGSRTVLRPEELQARIAAARKRRASSSESSLVARRAVYHSCEPSRSSTRAHSIAGSTRSSIKGKGLGDTSIDTVLNRSQSFSPQQNSAVASRHVPKQHHSSVPDGHIYLSPPLMQRPRPYRASSSRSSFTQKKSPLSTVSFETGR